MIGKWDYDSKKYEFWHANGQRDYSEYYISIEKLDEEIKNQNHHCFLIKKHQKDTSDLSDL